MKIIEKSEIYEFEKSEDAAECCWWIGDCAQNEGWKIIEKGEINQNQSNEKLNASIKFLNINPDKNLPHPIKFGRWLLKHTVPVWDGGFLCWKYNREFKNTDELFEIFIEGENPTV